MSGRNCKCRACGAFLKTNEAVKLIWNGKNVYFCKENEMLYWKKKSEMERAELKDWDELYMFVKYQVLNYDDVQNLPNNIVTRLKDLRDGNFRDRKKDMFKQGYPFPVILATFKTKISDISFYTSTRKFENEMQMFNYIMAIIDNSINEIYSKIKREEKLSRESNIDVSTMNIQEEIEETTTNNNDEDLRNLFDYDDM